MKEVSANMMKLLATAGSSDFAVARVAARELAIALNLPLKQGVMNGTNLTGIYESILFPAGTSIEFPLDFVAPGNEKDFTAYTISNHGRIPENTVQGDYVMVPTYDVGSSIDFLLKYARDARWDIVKRAMEVLEASFVRKNNTDGWRVIISAGKNRGIMVFDDTAAAGFFTKRLVSLMKTTLRRNAGGNVTSVAKARLTDFYLSPEAMADMYTWDLTQIDDQSRNKIFQSTSDDGEGPLVGFFNVRFHALDELGVGQEYQLYFTNTLSGTMGSGDLEIVVGLDLQKSDSFVRPVRQPLQIFEDEGLHRQRKMGWYGWEEGGWSVLDARRVVLGSL